MGSNTNTVADDQAQNKNALGEKGALNNSKFSDKTSLPKLDAGSAERVAESNPINCIEFPKDAIVGSLGELAYILSAGTEIPAGFIYGAGLALLGAMCSGDLTAEIGLASDTRLYTVLYGESGDAKKSSALQRVTDFFRDLGSTRLPAIQNGVGSAEGLAECLEESPKTLLVYDELKAFLDKCRVQSSVLLPMVTSLFESHTWDNSTKGKHTHVDDARLSLIGCCTNETYACMWSQEAIGIGFPNRLFIVGAENRPRVAWPVVPDQERLQAVRARIMSQIARLPLKLGITDEARDLWGNWYLSLPSSPHSKRLDTIGRRILSLIALTTDKSEIDAETVRTATRILDYQFQMRKLTDPIDAEGKVAQMEEKIRRVLGVRGPLDKRALQRAVNYQRVGSWVFVQAVDNLKDNDELAFADGKFTLLSSCLSSVQ
jgi:hypothetical protein